MQAHIFAEGSDTMADDRDQPIKEYYQGLFGQIAGLHEELSNFTDARLHVLSEEYGVAGGEQKASAVFDTDENPVGHDEMAERGRAELLDIAAEADVMVVLLSTDVFQSTVGETWEDLVEAAKPGSVWCLGAARSSLNDLDFGRLEAKDCTVLTYQRVGVARIGTEMREEMLRAVKQKSTQ